MLGLIATCSQGIYCNVYSRLRVCLNKFIVIKIWILPERSHIWENLSLVCRQVLSRKHSCKYWRYWAIALAKRSSVLSWNQRRRGPLVNLPPWSGKAGTKILQDCFSQERVKNPDNAWQNILFISTFLWWTRLKMMWNHEIMLIFVFTIKYRSLLLALQTPLSTHRKKLLLCNIN